MAFTENDLSALSNLFFTFKEDLVDDLEGKLEATIDKKLEAALLPVKQQLNMIEFRLGTVEKKITFLEAQQTTIILALDQMNQRLTRVEEKVDRLEVRMDRLETRMDGLETRMDTLEADVHAIKVDLLENNIIPRLTEIESCYLSTFQRYKESSEKAEAYFEETDTLKKTVEKHSEQLRKLA